MRRSSTSSTRCSISTPSGSRLQPHPGAPIGLLNYLLSSHVWRQDHNGFSHQILRVHRPRGQQEGAEVIRVYLPPDANCPLSVTDHLRRSRDYINASSRQATLAAMADHGPGRQALHRRAVDPGNGRVTTREASRTSSWPAVGDVPTRSASPWLRRHMPELKVRVVNIVNPDDRSSRGRSTRTASRTRNSTRSSPGRSRSSSPSTIRG